METVKAKRIPIRDAEELAKANDLDQVIIIGWSKKTGLTHVVTYGSTTKDCEQAATGGNKLKRDFLNWPENICNELPRSMKKLSDGVDRMMGEMDKAFDEIFGGAR